MRIFEHLYWSAICIAIDRAENMHIQVFWAEEPIFGSYFMKNRTPDGVTVQKLPKSLKF